MHPNTFIIGAPKCGTSALSHYLSEHPYVFFSNPKEPFYWCSDFPHLTKRMGIHSHADYLRIFSAADPRRHQIVAEGSTNYLRSCEAVPRIIKNIPDARFIVMLRDPVEVAHAYHMEQVFARNEDQTDFIRAWNLMKARRTEQTYSKHCWAPDFLDYDEIASYACQLERFFESTHPDQRKIIFFDDFTADARKVYRETLEFLNLPDDGRCNFEKINESRDHRFPMLADALLSPPRLLAPAAHLIRRAARSKLIPGTQALKSKFKVPKKRNDLPPEFKKSIRDWFRTDIEAVEGLTGRDLSGWKC